MNIADPIRHAARRFHGRTAVIGADGAAVSYPSLDSMIDAAAVTLAEAGIRPGHVVGLAITGPNELTGLILALGLSRLGAASADTALPPAFMDACITEGGRAPPQGVRSHAAEALWARLGAAAPSPPLSPGGDTPCRIFGSSGTTGVPKFVPISHSQMAARVHDYLATLDDPAAIRICGVGLGITIGFATVLRTLWTGGTLVLTEPARALAAIERYRVESLLIAPVSLQRMLAAMRSDAPAPASLRTIEFAGSILPARLRLEAERRLGARIVGVFGATETGGIASGPVTALGDDASAAGFVHPGVEIEAVDEDGRVCPPGIEGVLRVRNDRLVRSYVGGDPALRDGWFYTGDFGALGADGVLRVAGRGEEVINAGGIKLSPAVIENVLLSLPQVTDAAAFGVPDAMGMTQIWAAIVASEPIPGPTLNALCREKLGQRAPRYIVQIKSLPRNANGKLLRHELVKAAASQQPRAVAAASG